jgi:hypothetical protein
MILFNFNSPKDNFLLLICHLKRINVLIQSSLRKRVELIYPYFNGKNLGFKIQDIRFESLILKILM